MGLRSILRWGFSGISFFAGLVLSPNVDRLMAAHGWDKFLTQGIDSPIAKFLPAVATSPWAVFVAVAVLAFTAGLWVDSALIRMGGRAAQRPKPLRALGVDSLNLARYLRDAAESYWREDATPLFAKCMSIFIRYEQLGFDIPAVQNNQPVNNKLRMIAHYLALVGRLLADGHDNQARQMATSLASSLPAQDFSSDNDRI